MITAWSDNFIILLNKITAVILQPPFIYFLGIAVLIVITKLLKEVIS